LRMFAEGGSTSYPRWYIDWVLAWSVRTTPQ
jgi:hypothetical protein